MVKKAEVKKKSNPLNSILGLVIAGGMGIVAVILTKFVLIPYIGPLKGFDVGPDATKNTILIAVTVWLALLALVFMVSVMMTGKDPETEKYRRPLPQRQVKKKK